ncbi:MAG: aldose 1-epimerase family protein [Pseudomonadota bacterium]
MVNLFGRSMSRRDVEASAGALSQFAGVRLMTFGDGVERGIRMLEFRTGTGLRFTVLVDRALDIADCEYRGMAVGWHSPAGFKHPGLTEYEGEGGLAWLRSFSGLIVTCGLDHVLFMYDEPAEHYIYGPRQKVSHSIHGRIGTLPARLTGYGERWEGDDCVLWCEGIVSQGTVFGEDLQLIRRIEAVVGTNEIRLHDRVVNRGFYRTPHMFCYHINVGYPVLAAGSRYLAPVSDVVWAAHDGDDYRKQEVGYRTISQPRIDFHEQVWQHEMAADADGEVPVAVVNDALEIGFEVTTRKDQFPCQYEWQNLQAGQYALGIEPSTNHVLGHGYARDNNELIWLEHGQEREYTSRLRILVGQDEIDASEKKIADIAQQPEEEYPKPSGNHLPLGDRK